MFFTFVVFLHLPKLAIFVLSFFIPRGFIFEVWILVFLLILFNCFGCLSLFLLVIFYLLIPFFFLVLLFGCQSFLIRISLGIAFSLLRFCAFSLFLFGNEKQKCCRLCKSLYYSRLSMLMLLVCIVYRFIYKFDFMQF